MLIVDDAIRIINLIKNKPLNSVQLLNLLCSSSGFQKSNISYVAYFKYIAGKVISNKCITPEQKEEYRAFIEIYDNISDIIKLLDNVQGDYRSIQKTITNNLSLMSKYSDFSKLINYDNYSIYLTLESALPYIDSENKEIMMCPNGINSMSDFQSIIIETVINDFIVRKEMNKADIDCSKFQSAKYFIVLDALFRAMITKGFHCSLSEVNSSKTPPLSLTKVSRPIEDYIKNCMAKLLSEKICSQQSMTDLIIYNHKSIIDITQMKEFIVLSNDFLVKSISEYDDQFYKYIFIKEARAALCMNYLIESKIISSDCVMKYLN